MNFGAKSDLSKSYSHGKSTVSE